MAVAPTALVDRVEDLRHHEEFCWGVDLYNHGFYWEAHEAWEDLWRQCERGTSQHLLLQGLIQCAAFCLRASMDSQKASPAVATRALQKLRAANDAGGAARLGIQLSEFSQQFADYASRAKETPPPIEFSDTP